VEKADENHILFLASAVTFDALLAAIPFILLLLVGASLVAQGLLLPDRPALLDLFEQFLPPHAALHQSDPFRLLQRALVEIGKVRGVLTLYTVPVFLWFSTRFFASVRNALNEIYDVSLRPPPRRGIVGTFLVSKARDLLMVIATLALFLVNTALSAGLGVARAVEGDDLQGWLRLFRGLGSILPEILTVVFSIALFALLYRFASRRPTGWRAALLASTFTAGLFEVAKRLYGLYLAHLVSPARLTLGFNLGAAILFVVWVYYTAVVFLLGAVVAETWQLRALQRRQRAVL